MYYIWLLFCSSFDHFFSVITQWFGRSNYLLSTNLCGNFKENCFFLKRCDWEPPVTIKPYRSSTMVCIHMHTYIQTYILCIWIYQSSDTYYVYVPESYLTFSQTVDQTLLLNHCHIFIQISCIIPVIPIFSTRLNEARILYLWLGLLALYVIIWRPLCGCNYMYTYICVCIFVEWVVNIDVIGNLKTLVSLFYAVSDDLSYA